MSFKDKLLADLEKTGEDMTKAVAGGGDYTPPAAGVCRLRFFSYVELGKHEKTIKGQKKVQERVRLGFEISGPNHPPREDGTPMTIFIEETKSLNEKANFFKLFTRMNHAGKAKHIVGLLGEGYLATIYHRSYKDSQGTDRVAAELRAKGEPYDIRPTSFQNPATGQTDVVAVDPLKSPEQCLLWDRPDLEQWASIFVEGEYPERKDDSGKVTKPASSKNVIQARIMKALNFKGSAVETLLKTNGKSLDIPDVEDYTPPEDGDDAPATTAVAPVNTTDALNGIA
jgi:hypothetical protein